MSSSSSELILVSNLKTILSGINFYFGIFIFTFGILGNILNILVLSQKTLRSNPCVIIFLGSSVSGIIAILSGLTSRVLSSVSNDLSSTVNWICKFRGFILFASRALTFWLIMFATIDRWLLSSIDVNRRQMSSKRNSLRGIFLLTIISILLHSTLFYCYEANLIGTPLKCFSRDLPCRLNNDLTFAIAAILLPLFCISIFGWLTILNTRKSRNRIEATATTIPTCTGQHLSQQSRSKKTDQRLLVMLFVQVIFLALFTLPLAIQKLYATLTMNIPKSLLQTTIEDFIYQVALICTYFATGMPFYINTLTGGSVFRKGILTFKQLIIRTVLCR